LSFANLRQAPLERVLADSRLMPYHWRTLSYHGRIRAETDPYKLLFHGFAC